MTEPNMEWEKEFVEKGADIEHDRWARWQKYMFSKGVVGPDGEFHLPEELVDRWFRQIDTPYSELSESEKESDRKETRNYLSLIRQAISQAEQRGAAEERRRISEDVEKIKENYNGKCVKPEYYIESRWKDRDEGARNCCDKVISLIHDTK